MTRRFCKSINVLAWRSLSLLTALVGYCSGQSNAGVYDFGQGRAGERRGSWTPSDWLAVVLLLMTIGMGLAMSIGLCYYVKKRESRRTFASSSKQSSLNGSESLVARI